MAETKLVVEHREQLWSLLVEAAQIEHMIMCQYLYACFSLKTEPDEGLTAEQADAVARWQQTVTGIAIEEMLHLALAPTPTRPSAPAREASAVVRFQRPAIGGSPARWRGEFRPAHPHHLGRHPPLVGCHGQRSA
jgi:hypothetical protein